MSSILLTSTFSSALISRAKEKVFPRLPEEPLYSFLLNDRLKHRCCTTIQNPMILSMLNQAFLIFLCSQSSCWGRQDEISHSDDAARILDHLAQLKKLVLPEESLESHGYTLKSLSGDDLEMKKRCQGCCKSTLSNAIEQAKIPSTNALQAMSQFRKRKSKNKSSERLEMPELRLALPSEDPLEETENQRPDQDSQPALKVPEPVLRCRFHDGALKAKVISKFSSVSLNGASLRHLPVPGLVMLRPEAIGGSLFR